ncbi:MULTISPECIES: hypothetical protein [unclassified Streptomyces]|uniref:hypothetical protein n=1 Tax=unclassified Streptomyces TaxID=2593676 RepID=UPI0033BE130E
MSRTVDQLDGALNKIEQDFPHVQTDVTKIKTGLGALPYPGADVATRLTVLERLPGQITTIQGQITALENRTAKLSEKVKWIRLMAIAATVTATAGAVGLTGIKFDIQLIKIDLTLLKKIDEKNERYQKAVAKLKETLGKMRDFVQRERADRRRQAEAIERAQEELKKQEDAREKKIEEKLQKEIRGLPQRVGDNEKAIAKIKSALVAARENAKDARNDRTGLSSRHKGVDAQSPKIGPVAKDVKNLRSAVDELVNALAGI